MSKSKPKQEGSVAGLVERKVELVEWPVDKLVAYVRNPRKNDHVIDKMVASLREFSFIAPILAKSDGTVIDGHLRLKAAKELGYESVPVVIVDHLSDAQVQAYRILANRSVTWAEFDDELMKIELMDLNDQNFDLSLTGLDVDEIQEFLTFHASGTPEEEESIPEVPVNPVSRLGDVWILGNHRVMCGDSIQIDQLEKLMNGKKADLIFTDPPYGVSFERGKFNSQNNAPKHLPIANDELRGAGLIEFIQMVISNAYLVSSEQAALYCWAASLRQGTDIFDGITAAGIKIQTQIIWRKTPFVLGRCDYHWSHECCWYGFKEGKQHNWYGERDKSSVWDAPKPMTSDLHPTMKPPALATNALNNSTKAGNIVLDIFGGSGSTLIAAEDAGRAAYLMEIEPKYVDVIVRRWGQYTGQEATLESNGRTFSELKEERIK